MRDSEYRLGHEPWGICPKGKAVTDIVIRLEEPDDRDSALEVERLAFGSKEESGIVESVRDEEGFALVAEEGGRVAGHLQFSRGWTGETAVLALGPIGVCPQGRVAGSSPP